MSQKAAKRQKHRAGLLAACLCATVIMQPAPAATGQVDLAIGILAPLSGEMAAHAPDVQKGVLLAARVIHRAAGERRLRMRLVSRDSAGERVPEVVVARKLVEEDRVTALIGPLASEAAMEVATQVAGPSKVLVVSPAASAPDLTHAGDDGYFFRTVPSDRVQGQMLARLVREGGSSRAAVLHEGTLYGKGLAESFRASLEDRGGEVTSLVSFTSGQAAYRVAIREALTGLPEVLLLAARPTDGVNVLRQLFRSELPFRIYLGDALKNPEALSLAGWEFLEGTWGTAPAGPTGELADAFGKVYREAFGVEERGPFLATAFDAAVLIALAAIGAGSADGTSLRDRLPALAGPPGEVVDLTTLGRAVELLETGADIDYRGVSGPLDFDAAGDVSRGRYGVWEVRGGRIVEHQPLFFGD